MRAEGSEVGVSPERGPKVRIVEDWRGIGEIRYEGGEPWAVTGYSMMDRDPLWFPSASSA